MQVKGKKVIQVIARRKDGTYLGLAAVEAGRRDRSRLLLCLLHVLRKCFRKVHLAGRCVNVSGCPSCAVDLGRTSPAHYQIIGSADHDLLLIAATGMVHLLEATSCRLLASVGPAAP